MFSSAPSTGSLLLISIIFSAAIHASPTQHPLRIDADADSDAAQLPPDDGEPSPGWHDPRIGGGRMLDYTTRTRGEPLNVIISGASDPFVLTDEGFDAWVGSIGYAKECMGMHIGNLHRADLGDGDGRKPEQLLYRQHYRVPGWGTCWESLAGGQHFRAWRQNGTDANSGAWFLGCSKEEDSRRHHTIVANGYNLGRDWLVEQALAASSGEDPEGGVWVPYDMLSAEALTALRAGGPPLTTAPGWPPRWPGTGGERLQWRAEVEWVWGLLEPGKKGVNHNIPQDGRVAVLTVIRLQSDLD